jgi:hypothetical protein
MTTTVRASIFVAIAVFLVLLALLGWFVADSLQDESSHMVQPRAGLLTDGVPTPSQGTM